MRDEEKTREQLLDELKTLRRQVDVLKDIEEECRQADRALQRERDFAESLIETAQAIVLVLDVEGRIVRFNPYMEEVSGYRLEEVQGKDWFSTFLPKRDHTRIREVFLEAVGDIQTRGNVNPIITKDGHERLIEWYDKTLKDTDGNIVGLLAVGQDITERKRAEKQLKATLQEKEILMQEILHRTKNNMASICSLLHLQSLRIEDEHVLNMFRDTENRIHSMVLVQENLYRSGDLANLDLKGYLRDLAYTVFSNYQTTPDKISLTFDIDSINVSTNTAVSCGLLLNEVLTNAMKYAFPGDRSGEIGIALHVMDNGETELRIHDNGVGIPEDIDVATTDSLGLRLVTVFAQQLRGTVEVKKDNGTEFIIRFTKR